MPRREGLTGYMKLYRHLTANHVTLNDMPFSREIAMEAYVMENPDILALDDDELSTVQIVEAELALPGGRNSRKGDGRIDLLAVYGESTVGVIELKLGELNDGHLQQLDDYLACPDKIRRTAEKHVDTNDCKFLGVLVGLSITSDLRAKIEKGHVVRGSVPIAALTLNRYKGDDNNVYVVTDTFFHNVSRVYDKTQYEFDGRIVGKRRLVLACIKKYAEDHPKLTFSALEKSFPRKLQGHYGCFDTLDKAQRLLDEQGYIRFFLKPEEIIDLSDQRIAVCNQWGIGNIVDFVKTARSLGMKIREIKA